MKTMSSPIMLSHEFRRFLLEYAYLEWHREADQLVQQIRAAILACDGGPEGEQLEWILRANLEAIHAFYWLHMELTEFFCFRVEPTHVFVAACLEFGPVLARDKRRGKPSEEGQELLAKVGEAAIAMSGWRNSDHERESDRGQE